MKESSKMRFLQLCLVASLLVVVSRAQDEDFSEFGDFEEELIQVNSIERSANSEVRKKIREESEDDDSDAQETEFDHFQDSEEFEGQDRGPDPSIEQKRNVNAGENRDLKITDVPQHLSASGQSYNLEIAMVVLLFVYFCNFLNGRSKNNVIANTWLASNRPVLESNFALVGDDGSKEAVSSLEFRKETDNYYVLWCSGRQYLEGMLVELRLVKRQCLMGMASHLLRPYSDQITFKLVLESLEPFVFCLTSKKNSQKNTKDLSDIELYRAGQRTFPDKVARELGDAYTVHSESGEVLQVILQDTRIVSMLTEYKDMIELLHVSDQYQPDRTPIEEQPTLKKPITESVLLFKVNFPRKNASSVEMEIEPMVDLLRWCIYMAEKFSRLRLSKEAKSKNEKNRQEVEGRYLKQTHAQRQELAQLRREERIRQGRERIMAEDDPEKQKKLELREQKRLAKKSTPKLKQMRVRTM